MRQGLRVVHLVEAFCAGGVSSVVFDLAQAQRSMGYDVRLAALQASAWDDRAAALGLPPSIGPRALREVLAADIVHAHQRRCGLLAVLLGRRRHTVEHVHNLVTGQRRISFRGAAIIAVSRHVAEHVETTFPHTMSKVAVIRNGVAAAPVRRVADHRVTQARRIVGAGRLEDQKDPLYFLRIASILQKGKGQKWAISWYGEGPLQESFERLRAELHVPVELHSFIPREDLQVKMQDADLLLLTSSWEGFPMVALEALATGTPVAVTPCGDLHDLVLAAGAGVGIPFNAPEAAAMAIREATSRDMTKLRQAASNCFDEALSLDHVIEQLDRVYHRIL
jgi:glycosyltransferase involved in cell wall biosynthesis